MAHRQPFRPSSAFDITENTNSISQGDRVSSTASNKTSPSQYATNATPMLNLSGLKRPRNKEVSSNERSGDDHSQSAQNQASNSITLNASSFRQPSHPDQVSYKLPPPSNSSVPAQTNHSIRGSPAFLLPPFIPGLRSETGHTPSYKINNPPHPSALPAIPANIVVHPLLRPASAAPSTGQTAIRTFSRSSHRPSSAAPVPTPRSYHSFEEIDAYSQRHEQPTEHWAGGRQTQMTNATGTNREYNEYEDDMENEENIPPPRSNNGFDEHSTYTSPAPDGPGYESVMQASTANSKRRESEDAEPDTGRGTIGSGSHKRMRYSIPPEQQQSTSQQHVPQRRHHQVPVTAHNQAANLNHEFEAFYLKEAERAKQLREKWTDCTMQEWKEDGEVLTKKFGELTAFVQEYMTKKIQHFTTIQTRINTHNTELDNRDEHLRDARMSLVNRTGALVGEEDEATTSGVSGSSGGTQIGTALSVGGRENGASEGDDV